MKKLVITICALFISSVALANNVRTIYETDLYQKDTGVYEQDGYLFFVVKQQCLTEKKYSNHKEEYEAKKTFYSLLRKEVTERKLKFNSSNIPFEDDLKDLIFNESTSKSSPTQFLKVKTVINRNQKPCIREYVKAIDSKYFDEGVTLTSEQIDASLKTLLVTYISNENIDGIKTIFKDMKIDLFAIETAIVLDEKIAQYNFNDGLNNKSTDLCVVNKEMSNEFNLRAEHNFNKGVKPDEIIQDAILSINFNCENRSSWKILNSILRATKSNFLAVETAKKLISKSPFNVEYWVYYLSSIEPDSQQFNQLKKLLILIKNDVKLSLWAKKQL